MKLSSPQKNAPTTARNIKKVAIVYSTFNSIIGDKLLNGALTKLHNLEISSEKITIIKVPGALEIPFAVNLLLSKSKFDAVITLGIVIRGETPHFDLVAGQCYQGLMNLNLKFATPVIFGVITANTVQQAIDRAETAKMNKGAEFAETALFMAGLTKTFNKS